MHDGQTILDEVQMTFETANKRENLHPLKKAWLDTVHEQIMNGVNPYEIERLPDFLERHDYELIRKDKKVDGSVAPPE